MIRKKVLLVGETWISSATHLKGFDQFSSVTVHSGAAPLLNALAEGPFDVTHMPAHDAVEGLPFTADGLDAYAAIVLSDVGANSLLLHPDVWLHGKTVPNRLKLLHDWTTRGGGLVMMGGYLSFQGIDGKARWHRTAVEAALPVDCLPYDDRIEVPEGFSPEVLRPEHPILAGLAGNWPILLGANEVRVKQREDVEVLIRAPEGQGGFPLLVIGQCGRGRTMAWMSDVGPHWLPQSFLDWPGYGLLWRNAFEWLTGER